MVPQISENPCLYFKDKDVVDVSILSANFNNGQFLEEYFKSILNSECRPREIVIVDDGSTDDSVQIIKSYQNCARVRIICIFLEKNIGFANALNLGLEHCSARYIARLDPDDYIDPKRIKEQYLYLSGHPNIDGVGTNALYVLCGVILNQTNFVENPNEIVRKYQNGEHGLLHGTVMIKGNIFRGYRYNQKYVPAEDYDIFSRMINDGNKFTNIMLPLTFVRIHGESVSNNLPYKTIELTHHLRYKIFGLKSSIFFVFINYCHMKYYRKFLFEKSFFKKSMFLLVSASLRMDKSLSRVLLFVRKKCGR